MSEVRAALARLRELPEPELERLCRHFGVRVLTVFGSALERSVPDPADLDVGVVFEPGAEHDVLGLLEALVPRLGSERLDILDAGRASETARMRAIAEGEPVYESEPTAYAMAAAAAEALFWETEPMRRAALAEPR